MLLVLALCEVAQADRTGGNQKDALKSRLPVDCFQVHCWLWEGAPWGSMSNLWKRRRCFLSALTDLLPFMLFDQSWCG